MDKEHRNQHLQQVSRIFISFASVGHNRHIAPSIWHQSGLSSQLAISDYPYCTEGNHHVGLYAQQAPSISVPSCSRSNSQYSDYTSNSALATTQLLSTLPPSTPASLCLPASCAASFLLRTSQYTPPATRPQNTTLLAPCRWPYL